MLQTITGKLYDGSNLQRAWLRMEYLMTALVLTG
jgi:hypothetical protein